MALAKTLKRGRASTQTEKWKGMHFMRMKKSLWFNVTIIVGAVAFMAIRLKADDVYNFYFQKAPGPQTVIQGGGQPSAPNATSGGVPSTAPASALAPQSPGNTTAATTSSAPATTDTNQNTTKVAAPAPTEEERKWSRWEISLTKASFNSSPAELSVGTDGSYAQPYSGGEWDLGVQLNIWSALGIEGRVSQAAGMAISPSGLNTVGYTGGIVVTPFRLNAFNFHFLDIAFLAGYSSFLSSSTYYDTTSTYSYTSYSPVASYYTGAKASINLGKNLAVIGNAEIFPALNVTRYGFGVAIKL
jgi:hypothetical protein